VIQSPERAENVHKISLTVLKPFLITSHSLSLALRKTGETFTGFWGLYRSQSELKKQVTQLQRELIDMEELKKENDRLHKLLEFKKQIPGKVVPARVIGRDLTPWRKSVMIDKGSKNGIQKRMAVVNAQGLVGRVVEVAPYSARVILLIDPESRVSTFFQDTRDMGVAEGDGSPLLRVTHIERQATIRVGDRILSSGHGGVYPRGIPIGQVEVVGTQKEALELFASVRPFVDFSKLEEVLCTTSSLFDA